MWTTNVHRARPATAWPALACVVLACAALLVTACSSSASSAGSSASTAASTPVTSATQAPPATKSAPATPAVPATSAAAPSPGTGSQTAADTFLAEGQDVNGTALHEPACGNSGCPLSGDSTTILYQMNWTTWSATEAVGTGTYKVDACNPSCAAGPVYPVSAVVTFSQPVKVCSASGTRWFWSRASFRFPNGLPKALQGQNAPHNPWTFTTLVTAAQQSCG
jgi:hypothetical protein